LCKIAPICRAVELNTNALSDLFRKCYSQIAPDSIFYGIPVEDFGLTCSGNKIVFKLKPYDFSKMKGTFIETCRKFVQNIISEIEILKLVLPSNNNEITKIISLADQLYRSTYHLQATQIKHELKLFSKQFMDFINTKVPNLMEFSNTFDDGLIAKDSFKSLNMIASHEPKLVIIHKGLNTNNQNGQFVGNLVFPHIENKWLSSKLLMLSAKYRAATSLGYQEILNMHFEIIQALVTMQEQIYYQDMWDVMEHVVCSSMATIVAKEQEIYRASPPIGTKIEIVERVLKISETKVIKRRVAVVVPLPGESPAFSVKIIISPKMATVVSGIFKGTEVRELASNVAERFPPLVPQQIKFLFNGNFLNPDATLAQCQISSYCTLAVVVEQIGE